MRPGDTFTFDPSPAGDVTASEASATLPDGDASVPDTAATVFEASAGTAEAEEEGLLDGAGRQLGDFELVEPIGRGSFAEVWRARQRGLAREVAVKVLNGRLGDNALVRVRFTREADLASRLDHPYAAHVYAVGVEDDGTRWIAMELVRGMTLARMLEVRGHLELPAFLAMMERLAEVVQAAHDLGLVHRDIKPANIVVRSVGGRLLPKLMDFGLARMRADDGAPEDLGGRGSDAPDADPSLTARGALLGSPAFMAPEQWVDSASAGPPADQYALGVVAWTLLTGALPYSAPSLEALGALHREGPIPSLGPEFPPALDAVLRRALAKRPEARWPDVASFARAIRDATRRTGAEDLPALDPDRRERVLGAFPTPAAEAFGRLADAGTADATAAALRLSARTLLRWLGVLALALRPVLRRVSGELPPEVVLGRLARGRLSDAGWADLAREQLQPWAARADVCPLPELAALSPGVFAELADLAGLPDAQLASGVARLEAALDALGFLADYRLVSVSAAGTRAWIGARRRQAAAGELGGDGESWVGLEDRDGALVLRLSPFVEVAPPAPGAPPEVFLFEGPGRSGSNAVAWPAGYERVLAAAEGSPGSTGGASQATGTFLDDPRPPWPGLDTWEGDDDRRLVGRERELEVVLNRLRDTRLLAVVGASGAGKSSFLRAGLLRALPDGWEAALLRPGRAPLDALAAALLARWPELPADLAARLRADPTSLGALLAAVAADRRAVLAIAVDPLEELVTLAPGAEATLVATALVSAGGPSVHVIATLRDDFLARVGAIGGLASALSGSTFLLDTPQRLTLARILVEPLRQRGYALEERDLAERIADELHGSPAALPLLSFAGTRLWDHRDTTRRLIPAGIYAQLGGVGGMVARHAESTWERLSEPEREATRALFGRLFTSAGTRVRAPRATLLAASDDRAVVARALDAFLAARLLVADEDAGVEVAHEALLSVWPRLADWHRERAALGRFLEHLSEAARQWADRDQARGLLWTEEALAELHLWRRRGTGPLGPTELAFVRACEAEEQRVRSAARQRLLRIVLALLIVIFALVGSYQKATLAEVTATQQAQETRRRLVQLWADRARELLADDPWRALVYLDAAMSAGRDDARIRTLVGAAIFALPPSEVLPGPPFEQAWSGVGGRGGGFLTADDELWAGEDRLHPPLFPGDRGSPCGGALHVREIDGEVRLATAEGVPVGEPFAGRVSFFQCFGEDFVTSSDRPVWYMHDGNTGERRWSMSAEGGAWLLDGWELDGRPVIAWTDEAGTFYVTGPDATGAVTHRIAFDTGRGPGAHGVVSPDRRRLAVWWRDLPGLTVFDLATRRPVWTVPDACGLVRGDFSDDGARWVSIGTECGLQVRDAATGELLRTLRDNQGDASQVRVQDGIAFLVDGSNWEVWDFEAGLRRAVWRVPSSAGVAFVGSEVWWVAPDGVAHRTPLDGLNVGVPDAPRVECGLWFGDAAGERWGCVDQVEDHDRVRVWDHPSRSWIGTLVRGPAGLGRAPPAFSADGTRIALGSDRDAAMVWTPGEEPRLYAAPGNALVRVSRLSPDGTRLASGGGAHEVRVHDVDSGELLRTVALAALPFDVDWSPDGTRVAVATGDGSVQVVDTRTWSFVEAAGRHRAYAKSVAWSEDGERLLSGGGDGTVLYRRSVASEPVRMRPGYPVLDAIHGPGPYITVQGFGGPVEVWDPEDAVVVARLGRNAVGAWVSADGSTVRYSVDGQWQAWSPAPWSGTAADLSRLVRCEVPLKLDGDQIVERTTPCPEAMHGVPD